MWIWFNEAPEGILQVVLHNRFVLLFANKTGMDELNTMSLRILSIHASTALREYLPHVPLPGNLKPIFRWFVGKASPFGSVIVRPTTRLYISPKIGGGAGRRWMVCFVPWETNLLNGTCPKI